MNNINNNYYNYFLKNYSSRRLKESIIYGIEIDYNKNILFILTDYGHISLFSINNLNKCPSKTLIHSNLPIYCSYYYNYNNKQILFRYNLFILLLIIIIFLFFFFLQFIVEEMIL